MTRNKITKSLVVSAISLGAVLSVAPIASANPMVGGAAMYANKNIIQNAVNSHDNTTLVAAVKAAGLVGTLEGAGPFTVFAPTNEAFNKLPPGTVDNLLKPENKAKLQAILTFHVVAGRMTVKDLREKIREGGGKATLTTVEGSKLAIAERGDRIELMGSNSSHATITIANVEQSNGVIQVVNGVLLP